MDGDGRHTVLDSLGLFYIFYAVHIQLWFPPRLCVFRCFIGYTITWILRYKAFTQSLCFAFGKNEDNFTKFDEIIVENAKKRLKFIEKSIMLGIGQCRIADFVGRV